MPDEDGKKLMPKIKMRMKKLKVWILIFGFFHIKIRLFDNFHENLQRKNLIHSLKHFWRIKAIMKVQIEKFGKMSLIYEFSISKLGYMEIFMKIWEIIFRLSFKPFLTNRGKNEDKDEKCGKMGSIFEFSVSKLGYKVILM